MIEDDANSMPITICTHFESFNGPLLTEALKNWFGKGLCYKEHDRYGEKEDPNLIISLNKYVVGCSRNTLRKCLVHEFDKDEGICLTLNPTNGMIWCYKCDISFQEIHQMYNETHGEKEDPAFERLVEFEDKVLELLNFFRQNKNPSKLDEEMTPGKIVPIHKVPSVVFGIQNIGNTCFFNSTMQALNATRELVDFYVKAKKTGYFEEYDDLLRRTISLTI